jgi:hypothetical protein
MRADLRKAYCLAVILLAGLLLPSGAASGAEPVTSLAAAGWEEYTPGRWNSLAERKVGIRDNRLTGEFTLLPRTGVVWEKKGSWDLAKGAAISLELFSSGTNGASGDYWKYEAHFPVAVTVVFGKDRQDLPWKTRVAGFFRKIWHGFPPEGIRLTYAVGNRAPVGSMYRLADEETVFILAGEEEKGKKVQVKRDLKEDFMAAYGRPHAGPVTAFIVRAERPSGERGPLSAGVALSLPGP